jgi:ProP effector
MTDTPSEATAGVTAPEDQPPQDAPEKADKADRSRLVQPVLERLFELYPHLFGAEFLPLKLGIFQELLALHPQHFERQTLKAALGWHTRSTRYLQSVAAGKPRHDLHGQVVEPVAPEHIALALLELFRRRQGRSQEDMRPKFRARLRAAFEASGLPRQDYLAIVQTHDENANALLQEALAEHDQKLAKQEALRRAFASSGKTLTEFAAMYGLDQRDVSLALQQGQSRQVSATS